MFIRKCKITYIAHGATVYSESHRLYDGDAYPPLNENGYQQIINIAEFIKKRGVKNDKILVSPALRTLQSAEILSKELKKEFEIIEDLTPRNYGDWGSLTLEQVLRRYPELAGKSYSSVFTHTPLNGEGLEDFNRRIQCCINDIVENNIGKRLLVLTHPVIIRSVVCSAFQIPPDNQNNIYIKSGSATQISYFDDWASLVYCGYVPL